MWFVQEVNVESKMLNQQGMTNTLKIGAKKPCGKECRILSINANLEYEDGKKVPNTPQGVSTPGSNGRLHILMMLGLATSLRSDKCRLKC